MISITPLEIICLILIGISLIKLVVVAIKPKAWLKVPESIFARPCVSMVMSLILAGVVLYFLLQELTFVQVFASMAFFMMIMLAMFSSYSKEVMAMANKLLKKGGMWKRIWLVVVVWLVLMAWVLYAIFV
ncbi:MAG: hypothetical protein ABIB71_08470 [Candidatus Woesearchaeota archaeon]